MSDSDPRLLGVVLVGGRSSRMGRDKAQLKTSSGRLFLDLAYDRLQELCDTVGVSGSQTSRSEYMSIADPPESHGPISGIYASLVFATLHGFDACVLNPVDTPDLTACEMRKMVDVFRQNPSQVVCAVAGENARHVEPLIAVYPTDITPRILDSLNAGQYSLQRILHDLPVIRVPLSVAACHNVNTPADLNNLTSDE